MESIEVAVRIRPIKKLIKYSKSGSSGASGNENYFKAIQSKNAVAQTTETGVPLPAKNGRTYFTFTKSFDWHSSNREVYTDICENTVKCFLRGINGAIITYGQSGTGKTFTMQGMKNVGMNNIEQKGVIQMAAMDIFEFVQKRSYEQNIEISMSMFEIYNQDTNDLLTNQTISSRQDPVTRMLVEASETDVSNFDNFMKLFYLGNMNRKVRKTDLCQNSSRSHMIVRISMAAISLSGKAFRSNLCLVDLAGSDSSLRNKKKVELQQQNEANYINKSLSSMSSVIMGLSRKTFVNFRNSTLTRLLQPFMDGEARVVFICCAGPSGVLSDYTRKTLELANCAKLIKYKARINFLPLDETKCFRNDKLKSISNKQDAQQEQILKEPLQPTKTSVDDELIQMEQQWKLISKRDVKMSSSTFQNVIQKANKTMPQKSDAYLLNNVDEFSVISEGEFTNLNSDCDDNSLVTAQMKWKNISESHLDISDQSNNTSVKISESCSRESIQSMKISSDNKNDEFSYYSQRSHSMDKSLSSICENESENEPFDASVYLSINSNSSKLNEQKESFSKYFSELKHVNKSNEDLTEKNSSSLLELDSSEGIESCGINVDNAISVRYSKTERHTADQVKSEDRTLDLLSSTNSRKERKTVTDDISKESLSFDNDEPLIKTLSSVVKNKNSYESDYNSTRALSLIDMNKNSLDSDDSSTRASSLSMSRSNISRRQGKKSSNVDIVEHKNDLAHHPLSQLHARVNKMRSEIINLQQEYIPEMIFEHSEITPSLDASILTDSSYDSSIIHQNSVSVEIKENKENTVRSKKLSFESNQKKAMLMFEERMNHTLHEQEKTLKRWEELSVDFQSYRKKWAKVLYKNKLVRRESGIL